MKALFSLEQPEVKYIESDDKTYIWICLNGAWIDNELETGQLEKLWQCDFTEIVAEVGAIDIADVQAHPEDYLDFESIIKSDKERISDLEAQNEMLKACLLEISEEVYG